MSERKEYKAIVMEEESGYELSEDFAESFCGLDITVGPKTMTEEMSDVVGIIDNCQYSEEGIVADVTIFDENVIEMLDDDEVRICPTIARELGEGSKIRAMDGFVTSFPGGDIGEVVEKE